MLNGFLNASPNAVVKSAAKSNFGNSLFHHFLISREYLFCRKKPSAVQLCLFDNFKKNAKYYYLIDRALVNNLKEPVFSTTTEAYLELCQTSKMKLFVKIVTVFQAVRCFWKKLHLRC